MELVSIKLDVKVQQTNNCIQQKDLTYKTFSTILNKKDHYVLPVGQDWLNLEINNTVM